MDALIAILAGGRGARLGGDKALAQLGGRPLISHPLAAAAEALGHNGLEGEGRGEVVVVAKPGTRLPKLGQNGPRVRLLRDPGESAHPLWGIVAALREAGERPVVVVAADMPFVTPELLRWLADLAEPLAVPRHGGHLHPLLGRYEASLLPALEPALEAEAALQETVALLSPREIGAEELRPFGNPGRLLFNVNTPEDLEEAERGLGGELAP